MSGSPPSSRCANTPPAPRGSMISRSVPATWGGRGSTITIIDQDQGHSGASTAGRDGFQSLMAEVGLGHAGAVLSLEVSRLARSSSDWYR